MPLRKMIAKLQEKWSGRIAPRRAPRLKSRRNLELELLESRDLMAVSIAPKILAVTPPNGSSVVETSSPNVIKVTYSEAMNVTQATNSANYLLFGPNGTAVSITSVAEEGATNTYDVTFAAGQPAGAYTLFVKGDQVDASAALGGLALANPGQLVVANADTSSNSVTTVSAPDGFNPPPTTLGATQTYALGSNPSGGTPNPVGVVAADFNGDGIADLAIVSNETNVFNPTTGVSGNITEVDIYTGNASGGFNATPATRLTLPSAEGTPKALVAFSPFTGETGFADLAVLDSTNNVDVFTNTFTSGAVPTFNTTASIIPTGATNAVALTSGDFNGDGLTDLAVLDAGGDTINFLPGTGNIGGVGVNAAPFGAAVKFALGALKNPTSIAEGSLQNPGTIDLAVGGTGGAGVGGVETVLNTGNNGTVGTFSFAIGQLIGSGSKAGLLDNVSAVAIGNLDADSGPTEGQDIAAVFGGVSGTPGSTSVEVLTNADLGDGTINAATSTTFSLGGAGVVGSALALSPQTPGGKADIVVATSSLNEVTVLQNTSASATPTFAAPVHYGVDANPVGLAVGAFNGDNSPDIVTVNNANPRSGAGGTFSVLRNNGDGTYAAPNVLTAAATIPDAVAVGDLNGDGIPDLVVADEGNNTVTVYLASNTTPGTYAAGVTYSVADASNHGFGPVSVTLADLTGTGKLDIITANSFDNTISILANNGNGVFGTATTIAVGASPTQVVAGLFDNSGHISLAVAHNGGGSNPLARGVSLLLGNGNRTFKPVQEILPNVNATAIAAGNFTEAHGAPLDLVVADASTGTVDLLRNNGLGVFTHATSDTFSVGANPSALAVGDFNRDGLQDVVAVSSGTNGANQQIAVLLNSGNGGFAAAVFTPLPFNFPINSVTVDDLNGDGFPDLVVGLTGESSFSEITTPSGFTQFTTAPADANVYSLVGNGDGTFSVPVPYMTGPKSFNTVVAVASDPLVFATTFTLVTNIVEVDLVKNGSFEARDLSGTPGTFTGWQTAQAPNSRGGWYLQSGTLSPLSQTAVAAPPPNGNSPNTYQAMADQSNLQPLGGGELTFLGENTGNPNAASTYDGSNFLYQDITLPGSATSLTFSMNLYLNSAAQFSDGESSLFWNDPDNKPDQQVRVDFIDPGAAITTTNVLLSIFQTTSSTSTDGSFTITLTPTQQAELNSLITPGANRTVRLRISEVNNQGRLTVGVENVKLTAVYRDSTPPLLDGPTLRNPGYQIAGPGGTPIADTTDPTLIGSVSDDGGVANIKEVEFSPYSAAVDPNFNMLGDAIIGPTGLDADGNFSVQLPNLAPSLNPISIRTRVIDDAGNVSGVKIITFQYQGPSVTDWQAVGPGPINTAGATGNNLSAAQYNTVVGRINAVLADPRDATGNTYLTAGDNGGIWRTTDGGVDWTPTTDYLINPHTGASIDAPIGAMGGAVNFSTGQFVVYAGMGDSDIQPDSEAGNGILVSTNGGVSWAVAGNSDTVLANSRISAIVVDPNNTNIAYAAVESGGNAGPGVYKTTDGGLHWVNVFSTAAANNNIFGPGSSTTPLFASGTPLASVTSMAINPFDPTEITIGVGNIGLTVSSATAGVYRSNNSGATWSAVTGGSAAAQNDVLPGAVLANGTLSAATSMTIGRVTVAYAATGVTNDSSILYVLITSPPAANPTPGGTVGFGSGQAGTVDQPKATEGATGYNNTPNIYGLYKSGGEQTLGITAFTHVQVREQRNVSPGEPDELPWVDVNFSGADGANSGVLVVDPTDPNVVYVGGSEEYGLEQYGTQPGGNSGLDGTQPGGTGYSSVGQNHGLIRVDTGNMIDTSYIDDQPSDGFAEGFLNDGDDQTKQIAAFDYTPPSGPENQFEYPSKNDQGYIGEGVSWLDVTTGTFNNDQFGFGGNRLPPNITSVAIDAQGRLVFGTEQGLYRAVYQGTGYDFTSGGSGIISQGGFNGKTLTTDAVPSSLITISAINGNLQISDLTSVALDPNIPGRIYTTQYNTGTAVTSGGLSYTSGGLTSGEFNPASTSNGFVFENDLQTNPDGDRVVVAQRDPTAPAGALNTIYEIFAFGEEGSQEFFQLYSSTQGGTFNSITNVPTSGLGETPASYMPVLAIDPNKIVTFNTTTGQTDYLDGLILGTNQIYVSRTSGAQFTSLTGGAALSSRAGSLISAAAFAPSNDQVIWAATNLGEVFVTVFNPASGGYSFKERDAGLPVGVAADKINSITVDPTNSNIAFITENGANGRIFMTTNGGVSWTNITGNLPAGKVYTLVTDPRPQPGSGAPNGYLYVGAQTGVYVSVNSGATWKILGVGLPHVPVVDLQFNTSLKVLVAGTNGRGAFEISTDQDGAHVVAVSPAAPVNGLATPLTSVTVTFNKSIASFPISQVTITGPNGAVITPLTVTDVSTFPAGFPNPHNTWQITFAAQSADGDYTFHIGPFILDQLGHPMDENQNGINGENPGDVYTFQAALNSTDDGEFVVGQYNDELGRPADTNGFITILTPVDAARYAALGSYAFAYVRDLGRPQLVQDLYGPSGPSIIGVGDLLGRAAVPSEISYWTSLLQNGLSYEQMIVSLAGSSTFFAQASVNGSDANFVNQIYNDLLHRNPSGFEENTLFVPQLNNAESVARTQDARALLSGQPYETLFIQSVYQQFLNRAPSSDEIAIQLNVFNQGGTQEQVIASLLGSLEYFNSDAPGVVGGGATASNSTLIQAMYKQLFPGYTVSSGEVTYWVNQLNAGTITATRIANILDTTNLYHFGTTGPLTLAAAVNGSVDRAYEKYLGRDATLGELNYWASVYAANPNYRAEDLIAAILGSGEYFAKNTTAGQPLSSQDQQFADALYTSVLGATNPTAESTRDLPFLAAQELAAREAVAQAVVNSPEYHNDVTTYVYKTYLGRLPSAFELGLWEPIVGQNGAPGGANGDEQLLDAVFSSSEYFLHQTPDANDLHTNAIWLTSLYSSLHVPFNAAQESANLGNLNLAYDSARLAAIQAFQNSAEYVANLTTNAYELYLGRAPSTAEITLWINAFNAGETQEEQIAAILNSPEYFNRTPTILGLTVQPSNKTFVDAVYLQLFPGYTIQPSDENTFVPGLNNGSLTRLQVATTLVGSFQYRFGFAGGPGVSIPNNGLIERAYQQYLGRAITTGPGSELSYWESVYASNPAYPTTSFLAVIFDSPEYLENLEARTPPVPGTLAK